MKVMETPRLARPLGQLDETAPLAVESICSCCYRQASGPRTAQRCGWLLHQLGRVDPYLPEAYPSGPLPKPARFRALVEKIKMYVAYSTARQRRRRY